ncbi:Retrovirus-related Pol polyprotein from transposon TNT 1-94 [Sesamum angolense]|uniref:Retrovirus-related Pol polyprotein from transposon TNT 1-94 n=1 Tax=Sesamum angolense TaxID=2727404 RepID=A0AAE1VSW1_9LAMI|nr:Retrovirus-related Pol polyprotein from transposon TNT 1-94 [Sesamum angolense]
MMDPQPDIERAISMVLAVEKRRAVHVDLINSSSHIMYQLTLKEKMREDLYRSLNEKKKKGTNSKHFVVNVDDKNEGVVATSSPNVAGIMSELLKLIQNNNTPSDLITNFASYAHRDEEFAGVIYIESFLPLVQNQFDRCIKVLRFDNGSEFINQGCRSLWDGLAPLCSDIGIEFLLLEPKSFSEVVQHVQWRDTMMAKIEALERNQIGHTYSLTSWKRAIVTVHMFLTLVAARGWSLKLMDVNNAFLHGHLHENLYMMPRAGYSMELGLVCKLERSLYGLKQASRQWNTEFTLELQAGVFYQNYMTAPIDRPNPNRTTIGELRVGLVGLALVKIRSHFSNRV